MKTIMVVAGLLAGLCLMPFGAPVAVGDSSLVVQNRALSFDVGSVVECGYDSSLEPGAAITIEVWLKMPDNGVYQGIVAKKSFAEWNENKGYTLAIRDNGQLMGKVGTAEAISSNAVICDNRWHYLVMTWRNGDWVRLFIDGVEPSYWRQEGTTNPEPSTDRLRIGQYYSDWSIRAVIDEVRISRVACSGPEITASWNSGQGQRFLRDASTIALWHMDEGSGPWIYDETGINHGLITNTAWTEGFPFKSTRVNLPPTMNEIGNKTVEAGNTLRFTISISDPDSDSLITWASNLPPGALYDAVTRTFTWTPRPDQAGTYSVQFYASDGASTVGRGIDIVVTPEKAVFNIPLQAGWNLICLPLVPDSMLLSEVFRGIPALLVMSFNSETQQWQCWTPGPPQFFATPAPVSAGLQTMEMGKGYWVYVPTPATLTIRGKPCNLPYQVRLWPGANIVGLPVTTSRSVASVLGSTPVYAAFGYNAATGEQYITREMLPGQGYYFYANSGCILVIGP